MRIAVVGGGIAGLGAAGLLRRHHDVWLYDKNDYVGGHAHTATMRFNGRQVPVDTAFVIFNTDTYPIFSKLLDHLGVASHRAPTSFSCNVDGGGVDFVYGRGRFRVRRIDWFKPALYRMVIDSLRFFRRASRLTATAPTRVSPSRPSSSGKATAASSSTTSSSLRPQRSGPCRSPPVASSMPGRSLRDSAKRGFSLSAIAMNGGPSRAEAGSTSGSSCPPLHGRLRLGTDVCSITRMANAVRVRDASGEESLFDHVIMAAHADQSLRMLSDASEAERAILGGFTYYPNAVALHHDPALMPRRQTHWAAWNYFTSDAVAESRPVAHTYWMNRLQSIDKRLPTFVSLNPFRHAAPTSGRGHLYRYEHPTSIPRRCRDRGNSPTSRGGTAHGSAAPVTSAAALTRTR